MLPAQVSLRTPHSAPRFHSVPRIAPRFASDSPKFCQIKLHERTCDPKVISGFEMLSTAESFDAGAKFRLAYGSRAHLSATLTSRKNSSKLCENCIRHSHPAGSIRSVSAHLQTGDWTAAKNKVSNILDPNKTLAATSERPTKKNVTSGPRWRRESDVSNCGKTVELLLW